jgi:hypothetical protein
LAAIQSGARDARRFLEEKSKCARCKECEVRGADNVT